MLILIFNKIQKKLEILKYYLILIFVINFMFLNYNLIFASNELFLVFNQALRAYEEGDYVTAEKLLDQIIIQAKNSSLEHQAAFYKGRVLIKLNREKEAMSLWDKYYDEQKFIGPLSELFKLYEKVGVIDEKLVKFKEQVEKNPDVLKYRYDYIHFLTFLNKVDEAILQYNYLISKFPTDQYLYKEAGDLLVRFRRYDEALKYYEKILKMDSKNPIFLEAVGNVYFQLNNKEEAKKYWYKIIEGTIEPSKFQQLANILQAHNMIDEAITVYQNYRKTTGNYTMFINEIADLYEIKNDYQSLVLHYFNFLNNENTHLHFTIESKLTDIVRKDSDACKIICDVIKKQLENSENIELSKLRVISNIYFVAKRFNDALDINLKIAKLTSNPVVLENYVQNLIILNEYDLAILALDKIISEYPNSAFAYNAKYLKASILFKQMKFDEAVKLYYEVANDKDFFELSFDAIYFIAKIYFENLNQLDKAILLFDKLESSNKYYFDSIYYKSKYLIYDGKFESAEILLNKLKDSANDDIKLADLNMLLGYLYIYQDSFEAAIEKFYDILDRYPMYDKMSEIFEEFKIIKTGLPDLTSDLSSYYLAQRNFYRGYYDSSEVMLKELISKNNALSVDALVLLYKLKLKQGKYKECQEIFDKYISNLNDNQIKANLMFELAKFMALKDKYKVDALQILEKILKNYPNTLFKTKVKALVLKLKGDENESNFKKSFFGY